MRTMIPNAHLSPPLRATALSAVCEWLPVLRGGGGLVLGEEEEDDDEEGKGVEEADNGGE